MNKLFLALALVLVSAGAALPQALFFQDKTIRIVAGYGAGSVDDAWTRMIARYLGKYIPGNPNIIVQNMPGAGAMIAANYVYKVAKPDGLTLGGIRAGLYFDQLVGRKEVQFDWPKFTWLGTPTQVEQIIYIRVYPRQHAVQNNPGRAQGIGPAQMRRHRDVFDRLLYRQFDRRNSWSKVSHTHWLQGWT
jgi:tripartite-type tricarboxylate transporter receptor subunit TctC